MKIVCLSTYPVDAPRHGGQHRLANIVAALRAAGHDIRSAGVAGSASYPPSQYFIDFPGEKTMAPVTDDNPFMDDWGLGELFGVEGPQFQALADKIGIVPDAIFVEQPWMFRFAERFNRSRCNGRAILLYGSENVEHRLKFDILRRYKSEKIAADGRDKVLACELHALKHAAQTFCVSQGDIDWSKDYAPSPPILAANGVIDRQTTLDDIAAASTITEGRKFALYCASAHPPNIEGFFDLFGAGAGCFPPPTRLVTAGGAGVFIGRDQRLHRAGSLARQYIDAGEVSEEVLRGLLATAHMIILPLTSGGARTSRQQRRSGQASTSWEQRLPCAGSNASSARVASLSPTAAPRSAMRSARYL